MNNIRSSGMIREQGMTWSILEVLGWDNRQVKVNIPLFPSFVMHLVLPWAFLVERVLKTRINYVCFVEELVVEAEGLFLLVEHLHMARD